MSDSDQDDEEKAPETYTVELAYSGSRVYYGEFSSLKIDDILKLKAKKHKALEQEYKKSVGWVVKVKTINKKKETVQAFVEIFQDTGFGNKYKLKTFDVKKDIQLELEVPEQKSIKKKKRQLFTF